GTARQRRRDDAPPRPLGVRAASTRKRVATKIPRSLPGLERVPEALHGSHRGGARATGFFPTRTVRDGPRDRAQRLLTTRACTRRRACTATKGGVALGCDRGRV